MKKLLLPCLLLATAATIQAAELPEPSVRPLPNSYAWFDAFAVTWAENPTTPYSLQLVDASGITVTKNYIEDVDISSVDLVEYQESEDSQNYPNARLVVTLAMIEAQVGSYYTLEIPAGAVNIMVGQEALPNEEVSYTFQLNADESGVTLPEPKIDPEPGVVESLSVVKMSWTGVLGSLDLLNEVNVVDENANIDPVSVSYNGVEMENPVISFEWSNRQAVTEGSAGDILVITLSDAEELLDGEYLITIPEGYLQVTDIETGTLYNDEIILSYTLQSEDSDDSNGIESILIEGKSNAIYDLNGVKVSNADFNALPSGVYIINGKKVKK